MKVPPNYISHGNFVAKLNSPEQITNDPGNWCERSERSSLHSCLCINHSVLRIHMERGCGLREEKDRQSFAMWAIVEQIFRTYKEKKKQGIQEVLSTFFEGSLGDHNGLDIGYIKDGGH